MLLSVVYPVYMSSRMLCRQLMVWRDEWSSELKRDIEVVLVDDGSPDPVLNTLASMWNGDKTGLPPLSLYRVTEDRPWHQHGATNLGCHVARGHWILKSDIDHIVPASTLAEVLRRLPGLDDDDVLTFARRDAPPTLTWKADHWPEFKPTTRPDGSLKPHPNSYVVSRGRYWRIGGYDEELAGYGTDMQFRRKLFGFGSTTRHLDHAPLIRVDRDCIPDANTTAYSRADRCDVKAVLRQKAREGRGGKTTVLDFPWERVF